MIWPALIATELVIILFLAWKAFTAPFGEEIPGVGFVLDDDAVEKSRNNLPDRSGNVLNVSLRSATRASGGEQSSSISVAPRNFSPSHDRSK